MESDLKQLLRVFSLEQLETQRTILVKNKANIRPDRFAVSMRLLERAIAIKTLNEPPARL